MRGDRYQITLIGLGVVATVLTGVFFYRELFPEYKLYQDAYVALEEFRSTYTGQPPPAFRFGVKQLVLVQKRGPEEIDRCTSCHVALEYQHFSPTQLVKDINGNVVLDAAGVPKQEPNPDYVFSKLDAKIAASHDPAEIAQWKQLKSVQVDDHVYDMAKVLQMHPLIGRETRPFENHPINEYGCTLCHSGNGRGLTTEKAHGPVFDGQYEVEDIGPVPQFTEPDPANDPLFARVFNAKPGHELLFQTTPILVGGLIEAKCMQCHNASQAALHATPQTFQLEKKRNAIEESYSRDLDAIVRLLELRSSVLRLGVAKTVDNLNAEHANDYIPQKRREQIAREITLLNAMVGGADGLRPENAQPAQDVAVQKIDQLIADFLGSSTLENELVKKMDQEGVDSAQILQQFIVDHAQESGPIFSKARAINSKTTLNDIDVLTTHYAEGKQLYVSQACYPCHRIAGFSRGGIGPELTEIGKYYPWFIKQSIVWPQADVATSTMPNFRLDHEELEDLMTFLLAQRGQNKAISESTYKTHIAEWEAGKKMPWEQPVSPSDMHDLEYGMTVFATQGCAACHRLHGFTSNVGFTGEGNSEWFRSIIPEFISGSDLVKQIEKHADAIDTHIAAAVRKDSILEKIETQFPGNNESFYSNFKYANRAKNNEYHDAQLALWKERVHRVLMVYIQEYGLGRVVGPRPNWSGIYRSDEWLMEHFRKPNALVARSIMPVFPFDETKFEALTYMLDVLAKRNRDANKKVWEEHGFNPEAAYNLYCAQCHGDQRVGNGPVSEWIYPIPKNLRNADFMRNLTREQANQSIQHGVLGGPMPPWGEAPEKALTAGGPVLNDQEIEQLVDWLYSSLPGSSVIQKDSEVPKWQYQPEDIARELTPEGQAFSNGIFTPSNSKQYYIKKEYYTQPNIEAGKAFFELNCAVCHGREGDGAGQRAGVMLDAKPRMLTNLEWLDTRDDLRLLRSIKYGVAGTSMQAWGDQTTPLQRLQLVLFIRSLSEEQEFRRQLQQALYQTFDVEMLTIDTQRVQLYPQVAKLKADYAEAQQAVHGADETVRSGKTQPAVAAMLYEKELNLAQKLKVSEQTDQQLQQVKGLIAKQKAIYEEIGVGIIGNSARNELLPDFIKVIQGQADVKVIHEALQQQLNDIEKQQNILLGKVASPNREEEIQALQTQQTTIKKLKAQLDSGLVEAKQLREQQNTLMKGLKTAS